MTGATQAAAIGVVVLVGVGCRHAPHRDLSCPVGATAAQLGISPVRSPGDLLPVDLPRPSEWMDVGPILEAGPEGAWDFMWAGVTPASIVKRGETYYLYYVASDGYRSHDGDARHRSIGVATSPDGIRYTKYSGNPIVVHAPFNAEEEGANSAGVTLDGAGNFVMFFGAAFGPHELIEADGCLAVSTDGLNFVNVARVLHHRDRTLHGYGDEIFPVAAFAHAGGWYVYYLPNGGTAPGTLGLAWGPEPARLLHSAQVLGGSPEDPVSVWGNVVWLAPDRVALFGQRGWWPRTVLEVRAASPEAPDRLSEPLARYDIPNLKRGAVFLDRERRTWFMYYNVFDRFWRGRLAPAGVRDTSPPTAPAAVRAHPASPDRVELSWAAAGDAETGVAVYRVYRDERLVATTIGLTMADTTVLPETAYTYQVRAVNFHGHEGAGTSVRTRLPPDTNPPRIVRVTTAGDARTLQVTFSRPVDRGMATRLTTYTVRPRVEILGATILGEGRTVTLRTSSHAAESTYVIDVRHGSGAARAGSDGDTSTGVVYAHSPLAGLVGFWPLGEGAGLVARDLSGHGNHGAIVGGAWTGPPGAKVLWLDGEGAHVFVSAGPTLESVTAGSFTFAAWARPEATPRGRHGYAILLRVGGHPAYVLGLSYRRDQRFEARVIGHDESVVTLASEPRRSAQWHHVAMVVDAERTHLTLYVDGEAVPGSPVPYALPLLEFQLDRSPRHRAGDYYIGSTRPDRGAGSYHARHFRGAIGDVRIFSRALGPSEIRQLTAALPPRDLDDGGR